MKQIERCPKLLGRRARERRRCQDARSPSAAPTPGWSHKYPKTLQYKLTAFFLRAGPVSASLTSIQVPG